MSANTQYYREDGTILIGTTNSKGLFTFPLNNSIGTAYGDAYTGFNHDWTTSSYNCLNWQTSDDNAGNGAATGRTDLTDEDGISSASPGWSCASNSDIQIYCVEQETAGTNPPSEPATNCTTCKIFVTTSSYSGNLGGVSGADSKCNSDAQASGGVYKALLGGRSDWPLQANRDYVNTSSQPIGTTNGSSQFNFNLTSAIGTGTVWTGLASSWANFNTCSGWTTSSGGANSNVGSASSISSSMLNQSIVGCNTTAKLYCVQQR